MSTTAKNASGLTLAQWMKRVDVEVMKRAGVSVHDLADQSYWDWWNDDLSPSEAAERALVDDGFPADLL